MFCTKIPRFIEDGSIRLRPLRVFDGPFLMGGLKDEDILLANGLNKPIASSWFFIWWWIKKTFMPAYCIECASGRMGFIGLYNLMIGKSAEMSLVIFDRNNRRMGYGTRAFKLFAKSLQRHSVVERILIKIKADNPIALSFWKKLGFVETGILDDIISMSIGLDSYHLP
ncbi:MAG: GNAT family N-acetyltransferase [Nitrospirae bacterium]|nr:GNAT family N-acetyltransferase [Nitrospirota bacterium]